MQLNFLTTNPFSLTDRDNYTEELFEEEYLFYIICVLGCHFNALFQSTVSTQFNNRFVSALQNHYSHSLQSLVSIIRSS